MLDADTVIVGPVLESSASIDEKFIVDDERFLSRFKQIYYDLDRISEIAPEFKYLGYGLILVSGLAHPGFSNERILSEH
jgi:hypothetical protein